MNNKWKSGGTYANSYLNTFMYDANGNIMDQQRSNDSGTVVDGLQYNYDLIQGCNGISRKENNRLMSVVNSGQNPSTMNFQYDALGNLLRDSEAEIHEIGWTVAGKIKFINRVFPINLI